MTLLAGGDFYKAEMAKGYHNYIVTCSGNKFYLDAPEFDINDIAHALSNQCRFTGHTKKFYSVAEHSCLVHDLMKYFNLGSPFEGLMHDAHEAYITDLASPWKAEFPTYKAFEKRFEQPMRAQFGLPEQITEGCKKADWIALFVEAHFLIPGGGADWLDPIGAYDLAQTFINDTVLTESQMCWYPDMARDIFMEVYEVSKPA